MTNRTGCNAGEMIPSPAPPLRSHQTKAMPFATSFNARAMAFYHKRPPNWVLIYAIKVTLACIEIQPIITPG